MRLGRVFDLSAALLVCVGLAGAADAQVRKWLPLAKDGVHDRSSPGIKRLQEPADALLKLAPDTAGNQVRWVEALDKGQIEPRANLLPGTRVEVKDGDVLLNLKGGTPIVRFPHRQHTLWLDCTNCHEHLFKSQAGGTQLSMMAILQGEQCGVCHGAVAFPLTECNRCHSVSRKSVTAGAPAATNPASPASPASPTSPASPASPAVRATQAAPGTQVAPAAPSAPVVKQ